MPALRTAALRSPPSRFGNAKPRDAALRSGGEGGGWFPFFSIRSCGSGWELFCDPRLGAHRRAEPGEGEWEGKRERKGEKHGTPRSRHGTARFFLSFFLPIFLLFWGGEGELNFIRELKEKEKKRKRKERKKEKGVFNVQRILSLLSAVYIGDGELLLKAVFVLLGFGAGFFGLFTPPFPPLPPSFLSRRAGRDFFRIPSIGSALRRGRVVAVHISTPLPSPRIRIKTSILFRKGKQLIGIKKKRPS